MYDYFKLFYFKFSQVVLLCCHDVCVISQNTLLFQIIMFFQAILFFQADLLLTSHIAALSCLCNLIKYVVALSYFISSHSVWQVALLFYLDVDAITQLCCCFKSSCFFELFYLLKLICCLQVTLLHHHVCVISQNMLMLQAIFFFQVIWLLASWVAVTLWC